MHLKDVPLLVLGVAIGIGSVFLGRHVLQSYGSAPVGLECDISGTGSASTLLARNTEADVTSQMQSLPLRILCWVMTMPRNHVSKARAVKETWGRRCDTLLFFSSQNDTSLPAIGLPVSEGRNHLWHKTRQAFLYVFRHYADKADWFMKADDDTYVVVENLRHFLQTSASPTDAVFFGKRFRPFSPQGYMSGGAGYVLSSKALRRFVHIGIGLSGNKSTTDVSVACSKFGTVEDVRMGQCLAKIGVRAGDSVDSFGRQRFSPFSISFLMNLGKMNRRFWIFKYSYHPILPELQCCSSTAISFHYITVASMRAIEYILYKLRIDKE